MNNKRKRKKKKLQPLYCPDVPSQSKITRGRLPLIYEPVL
jgi:hypothetical protein